ncbi:MAG: SIS domain-containing protein [Acidobacteriia bacterium]|nr:SIS domain-containing protein [Terriglobia bacterium]
MTYHATPESYRSDYLRVLHGLDLAQIDRFVGVLEGALEAGSTVYIFGNGGSGATASHIACDMNKGVSYGKARRFKVVCLNDNVPTMMAYANDVTYDDVFVEPLRNFLSSSDVVVGISGSGNSENVIRAIDFANEVGAMTVGLSGYSGGRLKQKARLSVHVAADDMQMAEDVHLMVGHMAMQALCTRG